MKLIAHEAPISIMKKIREITDYDYCLVHLLENQEYFDFFKKSLEMGRRVILDNSIFELGRAFNSGIFATWINKLHPSEYIIPDELENASATIENCIAWNRIYSEHVTGLRIGVVQGRSFDGLLRCYQEIEPYCDKIAISFNYSYYEESFPHPNKFVSWMMGRVLLINRMLSMNIIGKKPIHLLGAACPQEFAFYRHPKFNFIETIDTSNPVISGLVGTRYSSEGLWNKCMTPCNDLIDHKVTNDELEDILFNISKFSSFVND